jgi:branched-chain amino acid transport system permease protein
MTWVNVLVQGLLLGGLYALFATGLSLMFGVMRLVNLAHGDLSMVAAFVALAIVDAVPVNPLWTLLVVVPLLFGVGYLLQRGLLNFTLRGNDPLPPVLVTFGLSIILQNLLLEVFSADSQGLDAGRIENASIRLSDRLAVGWFPLLTLVTATPSVGPTRLIFAFEAVIIGGLGSIWGTLAGGLVLGVAQTLGAQLSPGWGVLAGHLVFLAVLAFRPTGLLGREVPA